MGNAANHYLWKPRPHGPIYIRFRFKLPGDSTTRHFVRSLGTCSYREARQIRDRGFAPLISALESAHTAYDFASFVVNMAQVVLDQELPHLMDALQIERTGSQSDSKVTPPASTETNGMTWGELSRKYLAHISSKNRRAVSTVVKYTGQISTIDEFIGKRTPLHDIDRAYISGFLDFMEGQNGRADTTINKYMARLGAVFNFGIARGILSSNPAKGVRIERAKQKKRRAFTRDEADAVLALEAPKSSSFTDETFKAFSVIARYTGARIGEIAKLNSEDIVVVQGVRCIKFMTEKTGSRGSKSEEDEYRYTPIAPKLETTINACLERHSTGRLFPNCGDWKWKPAHYLMRAFNRAVKKIALDVSFHCWRHYAISQMTDAGVPREIRLKLVGHKDGSVHGGYAHTTVAAMLQGVKKIY